MDIVNAGSVTALGSTSAVLAMVSSLLDLAAEIVFVNCKYKDLSLLHLPLNVHKLLQDRHKCDCNSCDVLYYTGNICRYCYAELCEERLKYGIKTPYF